MTTLDPYERVFIHTLLPIHFASLFIAIVFFMIIWEKAPLSSVKKSFLTVHLLIIIWLVGKILKTVAPVLFLRWSFNVIYYMGILPLGPAFFIFSRNILNKEIRKNIQILLYLPSIILFVFVITNPIHYLFYDKYNFFKDSFGPVFYVHFIITYLFMIISIFTLLFGAYKYKNKKPKALALVAGALLPLFINLEYILDLINPMFDITPIVYNFSIIILGFATFNLDLFNILPATVIKALNSLPGAIKIENKLMGIEPETVNQKNQKSTYNLLINNQSLAVERYVNTQEIHNRIAELKEVEKSKTELNRQINIEINKRVSLIVNEERMRLAGEIHDILGYSLSSIICLLERCRFSKLKDSAYKANIDRALAISAKSKDELTNLETDSKQKWREHFIKLLSEIELYDLQYELIMDRKEVYSENSYHIFYKILKEAITNCIKYSNAEKITIAIQQNAESNYFYIIDDGKGCENIIQGTGLSNMIRRIDEVKGEIRFYSEKGSGFQIYISFPQLIKEEKKKSTDLIFSL